MNRLTKQINLILISSSLILHGCEHRRVEMPSVRQRPPPRVGPDGKLLAEDVPPELLSEEEKRERQGAGQVVGSPVGATPAYPGGGYYPGHHVFIPIPLSNPVTYGGGRSSVPSTASGVHSTSAAPSGGGASVGGSVRGGFGSSAHGATS